LKSSNLKGIVLNTFLVLLSTFVAMGFMGALCEIYLTLFSVKQKVIPFRPPDIDNMWKVEADLGYINKPDFKFTEGSWWGCREKLTSKGTRGTEFERNKPKDTYRILGLGDSVCFGVGVCSDNIFLKKLENKLNDKKIKPKFEVINAAVIGYSSMQEYLFFLKYGQYWNPDMVIITVCPNDRYASEDPFRRRKFIHHHYGNGKKRGSVIVDKNKEVHHKAAQPKDSFGDKNNFFSESKLLALIKRSVKNVMGHFGWKHRSWNYVKSISEDSGKKTQRYFNVISQNPEVMEVFKKIVKVCHEKNIELLVAYIPYSTTFYERFVKEDRAAIKLFEDNKVAYIDFYDIFKKTLYKNEFFGFYKPDIYLPNDQCHLSKSGHDLVANYLYEIVTKRTGVKKLSACKSRGVKNED